MKTFSTDGRVPLGVVLPEESGNPTTSVSSPDPADIQATDQDEALDAYARPRMVTLPGREPLDLEAISDLWLD